MQPGPGGHRMRGCWLRDSGRPGDHRRGARRGAGDGQPAPSASPAVTASSSVTPTATGTPSTPTSTAHPDQHGHGNAVADRVRDDPAPTPNRPRPRPRPRRPRRSPGAEAKGHKTTTPPGGPPYRAAHVHPGHAERGLQGASTVTVSQTRNLVNQMVQVSWTGFTPSSQPTYDNEETAYPVMVAECKGTNPANPEDCYDADTGGIAPRSTLTGRPTPPTPPPTRTAPARPTSCCSPR